jgi:agmatine deiminase
MSEQKSIAVEDGFSMPAEWEPHEACLMEWPTLTRGELWGARFEEAKHDYAAMATAIGAFDPVVMVCDPDQAAEVCRFCGDGTEITAVPPIRSIRPTAP